MTKIVQTAGRDTLGKLAPEFAHYNDDVLFGENWNNQDIDIKTRCIITVTALMSSGITDTSLQYHLQNAKNNGVSKKEMVAIVTHLAFYVGWPKAWAVCHLLKDVYPEDEGDTPLQQHCAKMIFPLGDKNDAYAKYFKGQSYLAPISNEQVQIANVTFEPACRNNWHIHNAKTGGGQILLCLAGEGYYQEEGKPVQHLCPGDCVNIPANVKHWHGATKNSYFSHLAIAVDGTESSTTWLEEVNDEYYNALEVK